MRPLVGSATNSGGSQRSCASAFSSDIVRAIEGVELDSRPGLGGSNGEAGV